MRGVIPITEQFQHFVEGLKGEVLRVICTPRQFWKHALELESARLHIDKKCLLTDFHSWCILLREVYARYRQPL